jgi:CDGSH-type Zn-finger protein
MDKPVCAQNSPIKLDLEAGQYWWCSCGLSKKQPFCDGSHKGTSFAPLAFKLDKQQTVWLCACKQTARAPFCDGAHKGL